MFKPSLSETSALLTVLENRSFTKAAEQLGLSPARVSELVRNLEKHLDMRLVERTTRSVTPTAAGARLLQRLRPLLDEYQAVLESLNDYRSKPEGLLRLTVAPPAVDFVLAPLIARFVAQYPEISLDISVDRSFVDIVAARFDAGIRPGERIARDMIALRISDEVPFVTAASPAYIKQHGIPATPQNLTKHSCICFRLPSGAPVPWRFGKQRRMFEVQVEGPLTATEPGIAVRAANDGAGLVQIPFSYIASEIASGHLVAVLVDWVQPRLDGFFLYYSSRRQMRPPLKAFVAFLREAHRRSAATPRPTPIIDHKL
jgi:DNA-binding transcriptional LysR family regulator